MLIVVNVYKYVVTTVKDVKHIVRKLITLGAL